MGESNIERKHRYILQELQKHDGWSEVKIKNGYFVEANLKIAIKR